MDLSMLEQRSRGLLDIAFCGLIGRSVVVYLDDVTIFSKKREEHAFHLKQIFERCRKYGISLNPKKYVFAITEGKPLGHVISKKGISIDLERIRAIEQIPLPLNKERCAIVYGDNQFRVKVCARLYKNHQMFATNG